MDLAEDLLFIYIPQLILFIVVLIMWSIIGNKYKASSTIDDSIQKNEDSIDSSVVEGQNIGNSYSLLLILSFTLFGIAVSYPLNLGTKALVSIGFAIVGLVLVLCEIQSRKKHVQDSFSRMTV